MNTCLGCGVVLAKRQKVYCSVRCMQRLRQSQLVLVLDHVDGDASNNRRENLRLICPNCDSQLPTYKSRNRGKGRAWRRERYASGKSY